MEVLYQAYHHGKKLGKPRTEKEKVQVESCCKDILWDVIPSSNLEIREVRR